MRIITISREFGSGGRELGKRLAEQLGFDYYDREIIAAIAAEQGLDESYVEKTIDSEAWRSVPLTFRQSLSGAAVMQVPDTELLLAQKRVIERIAASGRDCVIVGRNADVFLADYKPFHIFVCADTEAKVRRCLERAEKGEAPTRRELVRQMRRIDRNRAKTRSILTGTPWGVRGTYHLTVNTGDWEIKALTPAVAEFALRFFGREQ